MKTAPYLYDHYYPGPDAVRVGEVEGVPVYARRWLTELYPDGQDLEIDCATDATSDSFSLESELGCRLTLGLAGPGKGLPAAG